MNSWRSLPPTVAKVSASDTVRNHRAGRGRCPSGRDGTRRRQTPQGPSPTVREAAQERRRVPVPDGHISVFPKIIIADTQVCRILKQR